MVNKLTNVTSLTRNGLRDWLVQRVSSLVLAAYTLFILGFFLFHPGIDFYSWQALFASSLVRIFSLIALLSVLLHAWIGIWTVATDYLKQAGLRLAVLMVVLIGLLACFFWGIEILWGFA